MNAVTCAQVVLIGLGLVLQFAARVAWRSEWVGVPKEKKTHVEAPEPKPLPKRRNSAYVRPSAREKDYYEIERTPQGVRPGDLLKTAKVKYVQDGTTPPA